MTYNGWSNYETWNVKLWMDNDEGTYNMVQEWAQEAWEDAEAPGKYAWEDRTARATSTLAEQLESYVDELNPLAGDASMFADILGAALHEVDYREIASGLLEEVEEKAEVTS